jgi:glycylpeptide N-tetradecanoyltransferase
VDDVGHNLLPRPGVINSYVVEGASGITDLCSFYHLPSTIMGNKLHNQLSAVYAYYNVATTVTVTELMRDLLVLARNEGADVFNCLDVMENPQVRPCPPLSLCTCVTSSLYAHIYPSLSMHIFISLYARI